MNSDPFRALYIHVPFCKQRCLYCDFHTSAIDANDAQVREYFEQLVLDIRRASKQDVLGRIESVYIGGGTPSYAGMRNLSLLLYGLSVSMHLTPEVECTMEANPDSLDFEMVKDLWALGVNRLSIGVQSFDDELLARIGRVHDAQTAVRAINTAHERFSNVSIDLMCGLPGQTLEGFVADVEQAVALGVSHVSVYPLSIADNPPFGRMLAQGSSAEPADDDQAAMMQAASSVLHAAGFARYEVASYARPGFECRHNTAYWTGVPYIGFGDGAVGMSQADGVRCRVQNGEEIERLDVQQTIAEDLMLGMRRSVGVSREQVERAAALLPEVPAVFSGLCADGLAEFVEGRYQPTELGWLCGNELYGRVFDLAP